MSSTGSRRGDGIDGPSSGLLRADAFISVLRGLRGFGGGAVGGGHGVTSEQCGKKSEVVSLATAGGTLVSRVRAARGRRGWPGPNVVPAHGDPSYPYRPGRVGDGRPEPGRADGAPVGWAGGSRWECGRCHWGSTGGLDGGTMGLCRSLGAGGG